MKYNRVKCLFKKIFFLIVLFIVLPTGAQVSDFELKLPEEGKYTVEEFLPTRINISGFPKLKQNNLNLAQTVSVKDEKRLRLRIDSLIDPKNSKVGDYFKASVTSDFSLAGVDSLLIPKGSWLRGTISFVKKPAIFSMSSKIIVYLDQVVTPIGDVLPLSAELNLQEGFINERGYLEPVGVLQPHEVQRLLEANLQNEPLDFSNLQREQIIPKVINGHLVGLFHPTSTNVLYRGQELQVLIP